MLPDSRTVRGPGSGAFDVAAFVSRQPGYIRVATDTVKDQVLTGAQVVQRVSLEYSIDPRLLLTLLEFRSGWLSNPEPNDQQKQYPLGAIDPTFGFDRSGLYRQLAWAADQINRGYYGWKQRGLTTIEFSDGTRLLYAPGLNAGTVALQYTLAFFNAYERWQQEVSAEGFYSLYAAIFGDPFAGAVEPLVPSNLQQPQLVFPFPSSQVWFYTGGPHGGWGSGSAWAAVDFAPPDERPDGSSSCYISEFFATAVAPGIIARTDEGTAILDLDGDGDESTGWSILYLHIAAQDRVAVGTQVNTGDRIGRPSCEGGFSNGTHMHIARRYNGEWIPAACDSCPPGQERPPFRFNEWSVLGLAGQEYQGFLVSGGERRVADQGRLTTENRVSW
jgi:hypothetical protein